MVASASLTAGSATSAPIIQLNSGTLTLQFDVFQSDVSYYRVQVRQMSRTWKESQLLPGVYLRGANEDVISEGIPSTSQEPLYTSYTYRFPNQNMGVQKSGNYLMEVIDPYSGSVIVSLPFMVSEGRGQLEFKVEELFNQKAGVRITHQPFLDYRYPEDFVMPQLDVHVAFAQNRWWMQASHSQLMDQSEDGVLRYYLPRETSFAGSLDVYAYALTDVGRLSAGVQAADLSARPPSVLKDVDTDGLTRPIQTPWPNAPGARRDRDARYGAVTFQFETMRAREPMYVIGTFSNWERKPENRLRYDAQSELWSTRILLKEGTHRYRYVSGSDMDAFNSVMAGSAQEYTALVYYFDPQNRFDRLLGVATVQTR